MKAYMALKHISYNLQCTLYIQLLQLSHITNYEWHYRMQIAKAPWLHLCMVYHVHYSPS